MSDLISRQAAIDILAKEYNEKSLGKSDPYIYGIINAMGFINSLPSAQPERQVELVGTESNIEILSELRAQFNCFDEAKEPVYRALSDAICALSAQPEDKCSECDAWNKYKNYPREQWIPIKTRPMTDEERDYWSEHYGYDVEYEDAFMFDCKIPKDNQTIWVTTKNGYLFQDTCENDDGYIGLEGNGDWSDIVAWMPVFVPEPYQEEKADP